MHYPKDLQTVGNVSRKYFELALEEYNLGNTRQANTLYRRGKKYYSSFINDDKNVIPKTVKEYHRIMSS